MSFDNNSIDLVSFHPPRKINQNPRNLQENLIKPLQSMQVPACLDINASYLC